MENFSCIGIPEEWRVQWYEGTLLSSGNPNMTLRYSNYFYVSVAAIKAIRVRLPLREALRSFYGLLLDNEFKL